MGGTTKIAEGKVIMQPDDAGLEKDEQQMKNNPSFEDSEDYENMPKVVTGTSDDIH